MKKYVFVLLLICISITNAQIFNNYGIKIGGTLTHQEWNYTNNIFNFDPDDAIGFSAGVFGEFLDISNIELIGELNFIQRSVKEEIPFTTIQNPEGDGTTMIWNLKINYIDLTVLAKAKLNLNFITPYIIAGPTYGFEISKSVNDESNFYDDFNKSQFGIKFGVGSEFQVITINLLAEFSYNKILNSIYKNENVDVTSYFYDFRVGVLFNSNSF
ncbi:MAG: PorT family protein [Ignavibacteriaceae bacterium]|nr:PorT family protein [Ignavibacteriaceae bacterium]